MTSPGRSFLLATWEGGGSVPPVLAVASKLVKAGHRVRIMSEACNRPECEATGADFIAWNRAPSRPNKLPDTDYVRDWDATSGVESLARVFERVMFGPASDHAADVLDEITRAKPDAIVTSEVLFGVMAAAEAQAIPFSLLCPQVSLYPIDGLPPFGLGLLPARTGEERRKHAEIAAANAASFNTGLPALNKTRVRLGLQPLRHVFDQLDRARSVLWATARAFDFAPPALPPKYRYVGPQLDDTHDRGWISPFAPTQSDDPLVLLSFSTTYQNQAQAIQAVMDALGTLPLRLLVTLGPALEQARFRTPANTRVVPYAPHDTVMEEAKAVITHGGHGTVIRALSKNCPMLVLPHGRDHNDNAARLVARGAGLVADAQRATAADIVEAVTRLIREPSFAEGAGSLGAHIRAEADTSQVVSLIEQCADAAVGKRRVLV